jgi:SHS2 domain-containing protein
MKKYQLLPHIADVRLQVKASTLPELFTAALEGMNELINKKAGKEISDFTINKKIILLSADITTLLIDFLSEILTSSHKEGAVFGRVIFSKLNNKSLQAIIKGKKVGTFDEDIKAVTYHEAEVKKNKQGNWETVVVFDI